MEKIIKHLQVVDYVAATCSLGYGTATGNWLWIVGGAAGLVLAKLNIGKKLSTYLQSKLRKKPVLVLPPPAESDVVVVPNEAASTVVVLASDYSKLNLSNATSITSSSRHSLLKNPSHLNHATTS